MYIKYRLKYSAFMDVLSWLLFLLALEGAVKIDFFYEEEMYGNVSQMGFALNNMESTITHSNKVNQVMNR